MLCVKCVKLSCGLGFIGVAKIFGCNHEMLWPTWPLARSTMGTTRRWPLLLAAEPVTSAVNPGVNPVWMSLPNLRTRTGAHAGVG